jgi:hypothetical protein
MSYDLSRITGTTRTNAPVVLAASATHRKRTVVRSYDEDRYEHREARSLMRQSFGPCG